MIQLFKQHTYSEAINSVTETLQSGWTGMGPKVIVFEEEMKKYLNTPYAVALSSGTAALQLALSCLHIPKGSYIITTPLTFIATNHSILQSGHFPVFADIEPDTGNISADSVRKLMKGTFVGARARAILPVHFGGMPVDMDQIYDISQQYHMEVIEDAAHAFGAKYQEERIGCKNSRFVCFSFHAVKPLAIGDGGLLCTYDETVDKLVRSLRWFGIDKSTAERTTSTGYSWDYDVTMVGYKMHMNDIQAAIGLGQFLHYEEDLAHRQMLVDRYRENLKDVGEIEMLNTFPDRVSANYLFVIKCVDQAAKNKMMNFLYEKGIQCGCHYRPNHLYRMYRFYETDDGCKEAINFFERCISLPLHVELELNDVDMICEAVKEGLK